MKRFCILILCTLSFSALGVDVERKTCESQFGCQALHKAESRTESDWERWMGYTMVATMVATAVVIATGCCCNALEQSLIERNLI